jgi:hypothetical protein
MPLNASCWIGALLVAALPWSAAAQQPSASPGHPSFSGTWRENLKASRWADGQDSTGVYTSHVMTIDHSEPRLKVTFDVRMTDPQGNRLLTYELKTDGRVYEFELQGLRAVGYARWEGPSLTIYTKRPLPSGGVLEVLRTLTLNADGRSMRGQMRYWSGSELGGQVAEVWERQ